LSRGRGYVCVGVHLIEGQGLRGGGGGLRGPPAAKAAWRPLLLGRRRAHLRQRPGGGVARGREAAWLEGRVHAGGRPYSAARRQAVQRQAVQRALLAAGAVKKHITHE